MPESRIQFCQHHTPHLLGSRRLLVRLRPALGGLVIFEPKHSGALEFD
jgi:hypothetical protein